MSDKFTFLNTAAESGNYVRKYEEKNLSTERLKILHFFKN